MFWYVFFCKTWTLAPWNGWESWGLGVSITFPCSTWIYSRWIPSNMYDHPFSWCSLMPAAQSLLCHNPLSCKERRPASLNHYQREFVRRLPRGKFLLMLLPHFRRQAQAGEGIILMLNRYVLENHRLWGGGGGGIAKCYTVKQPTKVLSRTLKTNLSGIVLLQIAEVCESLGAERLLDVLKREIYLRSYFSIPDPHISRQFHSVLRRMSLAALVSLACSRLSGPLPQLFLKELRNLREIAKHSEDIYWVEVWTQNWHRREFYGSESDARKQMFSFFRNYFNCRTCARIIEKFQYEWILKIFETCWPR